MGALPATGKQHDFFKQSGFFAMQQLLQHKPDVGFAGSDTVAIGPLRW
jgi:DNA-binding LacI/PurR family transcriptional regulator